MQPITNRQEKPLTTFQIWQLIIAGVGVFAALIGSLYAVVTRPLLRHLDAIEHRLDSIERRLENIETLLLKHEERITRVEERTSPWRP